MGKNTPNRNGWQHMTSRAGDNRRCGECETYGRHSRAHASVSVAALLQQAMAEGQAIRLA
jgi:hypothetical protein